MINKHNNTSQQVAFDVRRSHTDKLLNIILREKIRDGRQKRDCCSETIKNDEPLAKKER